MARWILGISAFYHDAAAALIRDGEIVAAAQEERFSRRKHDPRFPHHAVNYCLEEAFIDPASLDAIVFYDNPLITWDRVLKTCLAAGARGREQFGPAARSILGVKLWVKDYIERSIGTVGRLGRVLFAEHHMAHAASAFYPSPFERAAIVTLDGVGEWATTTIGRGEGDQIDLLEEIHFPHSLGLLYSAFTSYCGFKVNSGEYKLMGLAPYGEPRFYDVIIRTLIDVKPDGSYRLDASYFGHLDSLVMTTEKFNSLFGGPPRQPESRITQKEMDLAASIQKVTEEVVLKIAAHAREVSGASDLVMAGGVALNCVANGRLLRERVFERLWVQPAAGDAGGAIGAALLGWHAYFGGTRPQRSDGRDHQKGSYLGPAYTSVEVRAFLDRAGYPYERVPEAAVRAQVIAEALAAGKVVGYCAGRMEFGPRALGARSILGDPRRAETQSVMNLKIKYRESFRPFAPAVLVEDVSRFFDLEGESPYMLLVAGVREERRLPTSPVSSDDGDADMMPIINQTRSDIPAVTHVDYSARVQTVHPADNARFHEIITKFKELTGYGVVVNTSFNVRGEPIVCSPNEAYTCFMRTAMDMLVIEDCVLRKEAQPAWRDTGSWRDTYELD